MSPSYPIVFYVSGHGFGHSVRAIAVIQALYRARPDVRVMVRTSAPRQLYADTLGDTIGFAELEADAGVAQLDSLSMDVARTIERARDFEARLPELAPAEARFLRDSGTRVVVGDIPPLACAAATAAGLPSIAIGNFTWDWIYEYYREMGTHQLAEDIRRVYREATVALRLPMCGGFSTLEPITRDIPFIARRSERTGGDVRRTLGIECDGTPLVLLSFGGYGIAGLDISRLAAWRGFTIATTDPPSGGPNADAASGLARISRQLMQRHGLRYYDLVKAADVVVTKPGYGIVSDAIANDAAILYTSRGPFAEYDVFLREMPRYVRAQFIEQEELLRGNWKPALERLLDQPPPPERPSLNGAAIAAEAIVELGT